MRKLKLEVQLSLDGFAADNKGKLDWVLWEWGPDWTWEKDLQQFHIDLHKNADTILLGRSMAEGGFLDFWKDVTKNPSDARYEFAKQIVAAKKFEFSHKLRKPKAEKSTLVKGDLTKEIMKIKQAPGKDILVYGGVTLVSSLIAADLIDEYNLIVNPVLLGKGKPIFKTISKRKKLKLLEARCYNDGMMLQRFTK